MREALRVAIMLAFAIACRGPGAAGNRDTGQAQQSPDSPAAALGARTAPAGADVATADGKEPGTIPATPTPAVTSESSIATMRAELQGWETASVATLEGNMKEHSRKLGDLLTTMRVQVQSLTSSSKNSWLVAADSVESDLDRLALAHGEELRTACRQHRDRVTRLLDQFRVLVPARAD